MSYSPLAIKRLSVLGDLYSKCESINSIPVYMDSDSGEMLGYVDESLGRYADAFLFHLSEEVCKKLSTGLYTYSFDYDFLRDESESGKKRIVLNYFVLTGRKNAKSG